PIGSHEAMQVEARRQVLAICGKSPTRDPDGIFTAVVRPPVEPAVACIDREAGFCEQCVPAFGLEPPELHRRLAARPAYRERECLLEHVPVRALVDSGLALDPPAVRLVDVVL